MRREGATASPSWFDLRRLRAHHEGYWAVNGAVAASSHFSVSPSTIGPISASTRRVVGVEPDQFLARQQLGVDQPAVERRQRQRLEAVHGDVAAVDRFGRRDQDQVLDADAVGAFAVVAGLVGEDHAGQQLLGCRSWRCAAALHAPTDRSRRRGRCRARSRGRPSRGRCGRRRRCPSRACPAGKRSIEMPIMPLSTIV